MATSMIIQFILPPSSDHSKCLHQSQLMAVESILQYPSPSPDAVSVQVEMFFYSPRYASHMTKHNAMICIHDLTTIPYSGHQHFGIKTKAIPNLNGIENIFLDLITNHVEYTEGYYYLGLLYAEQEKFEESANYLERAMQQENPNPRVYYNLGLVYQQLKEIKKAEAILLNGYNLMQNNFDLIFALSDFYLKQKNIQKALLFANELKLKFPSRPEGQGIINYINSQQNL